MFINLDIAYGHISGLQCFTSKVGMILYFHIYSKVIHIHASPMTIKYSDSLDNIKEK